MLRSAMMRLGARSLHTSQVLRIDPRNVEEVRIPVPWGHIAGKWWGSKGEGRPVIVAVHGWLDNAGSWDAMCEQLPDEYSVLAIDLPGNGHSSHFPPFISYTFLETPSILKRVVNYLNCGKVNLLGHSGGSAVCFMFACTFPEDVISYCGVDYLIYCYKNEKRRLETLSKSIDKAINFALRDPKNAHRYTWEEAKSNWIAATKGSLNSLTAEILMQRGVTKLPDGKVIFTRDYRVKSSDLNQLNPDQTRAMARNFSSNLCLIKGRTSKFLFDKGIKNIPDILETLEAQCPIYEFHEIDGDHHVHLEKPADVAKIYISFLDKVKNQ